ncbi:hypothetical protein LCM4579_15075 [Ensifer sp. LCM 4579]|nr:hypothetical protein LCM4579_15075 [Ensifer sp. LCM 4579]
MEWEVEGKRFNIGVSRLGAGPVLLLLPALSSISTRSEMLGLQQLLAATYSTIAVDWPGFGDQPRPRIRWRPEHSRAFLRVLIGRIGRPAVTVAAGHAAGYALSQSAEEAGSLGRLCLLSPTWRGPLPTMAGRRMRFFSAAASAVDFPLLGSVFYRLNVNRPVIGMMARGHVYSDPDWLTGERMAQKRAVSEAAGARHASFRFVTGVLDPFHERQQFLYAARRAGDILLVYARQAPRKSKAEMLELAALDNVRAIELPTGKLSFYEEFPEETARAMLPHLAAD